MGVHGSQRPGITPAAANSGARSARVRSGPRSRPRHRPPPSGPSRRRAGRSTAGPCRRSGPVGRRRPTRPSPRRGARRPGPRRASARPRAARRGRSAVTCPWRRESVMTSGAHSWGTPHGSRRTMVSVMLGDPNPPRAPASVRGSRIQCGPCSPSPSPQQPSTRTATSSPRPRGRSASSSTRASASRRPCARCSPQHRLRPAAVLLTHGHVDHVYSVTPVCGADTAAYIHADDRYRLDGPALPSSTLACWRMLEQQFGQRATWTEPSNVVEVDRPGRPRPRRTGLRGAARPGAHRGVGDVQPCDAVPDGIARPGRTSTAPCLSGDVLFAGSIGRTDLPGGDPRGDGPVAAGRRPAAARHHAGAAGALPGDHDGPRAGDEPLFARIVAP